MTPVNCCLPLTWPKLTLHRPLGLRPLKNDVWKSFDVAFFDGLVLTFFDFDDFCFAGFDDVNDVRGGDDDDIL